MGSLSLSDLPSGTLHSPAFDRLTFNLNRADGESTSVLTITRRCDGHVAVDKLHLVTLRHESCVYIVSSCEALQCCPNAPQEDLRYTLFNNGSWVVNGSRCLTSGGDLHCTGSPLGIQLPIDRRPAPESKEVTLLLDKFFSGFAALLNKIDSSSAIEVAWKGDAERPSLLSVWEDSARRGDDAISILARTTKTTKKEQAKANYLHWLSQLMLGCLVHVQTGGQVKHTEPKRSTQNRFITWSRRIPKILHLLSVTGAAALLILTALGNSFFFFADVVRMSQENVGNFTNTLWKILGPRLAAIDRLLQGSTAYDRKVPMFNPTVFTCRYLTLQLQTPVRNEDICKQLGVEDWATVGSEVFEERTIGEVFSSLKSFQSTSEEESQARRNNDDEQAHQWAAAWLQSNYINLNPAHNQDQILDTPNENTPCPADPSESIFMANGWSTEQPLLQATPGLDTLANAASQACPPHHDGDSGYGGSAMSSQFSTATSAMPIPTRDSETSLADPGSETVSLCETERDEASPYAALATGNSSTTSHLPVVDSTFNAARADGPLERSSAGRSGDQHNVAGGDFTISSHRLELAVTTACSAINQTSENRPVRASIAGGIAAVRDRSRSSNSNISPERHHLASDSVTPGAPEAESRPSSGTAMIPDIPATECVTSSTRSKATSRKRPSLPVHAETPAPKKRTLNPEACGDGGAFLQRHSMSIHSLLSMEDVDRSSDAQVRIPRHRNIPLDDWVEFPSPICISPPGFCNSPPSSDVQTQGYAHLSNSVDGASRQHPPLEGYDMDERQDWETFGWHVVPETPTNGVLGHPIDGSALHVAYVDQNPAGMQIPQPHEVSVGRATITNILPSQQPSDIQAQNHDSFDEGIAGSSGQSLALEGLDMDDVLNWTAVGGPNEPRTTDGNPDGPLMGKSMDCEMFGWISVGELSDELISAWSKDVGKNLLEMDRMQEE